MAAQSTLSTSATRRATKRAADSAQAPAAGSFRGETGRRRRCRAPPRRRTSAPCSVASATSSGARRDRRSSCARSRSTSRRGCRASAGVRARRRPATRRVPAHVRHLQPGRAPEAGAPRPGSMPRPRQAGPPRCPRTAPAAPGRCPGRACRRAIALAHRLLAARRPSRVEPGHAAAEGALAGHHDLVGARRSTSAIGGDDHVGARGRPAPSRRCAGCRVPVSATATRGRAPRSDRLDMTRRS